MTPSFHKLNIKLTKLLTGQVRLLTRGQIKSKLHFVLKGEGILEMTEVNQDKLKL